MKGLKISAVLLAIAVSVNIFFNIYLKHSTQKICKEIADAYFYATEGESELLQESVEKTGHMIERDSVIWQIVVNHGEVDEVHTSYENVAGCMDMDMEHICIYLRELWFYVDNLYQRERLTVYNIF